MKMTAQEIHAIQMLKPEEQNVVFSLVRCFLSEKDQMNEAQTFLANARKKHLEENPMTIEEIDRIIHDGCAG